MKDFPNIEQAFCPTLREYIVLHVRSCAQCRAGMESVIDWADKFKVIHFLVKDALKGMTFKKRVTRIIEERYGVKLFAENEEHGITS